MKNEIVMKTILSFRVHSRFKDSLNGIVIIIHWFCWNIEIYVAVAFIASRLPVNENSLNGQSRASNTYNNNREKIKKNDGEKWC